ncbi:differentially expressed in FDCP 8 homolog [Aphidius gifuensis]|uniref:differentially expressed in FDCP 8 homolog n=1 Tax=Aphidius gifuensis TaxID=684658 RepID=UPI001CDCE150|nr:differentially expressed in FDCP 8 homolog [Aphidius gifuensis]
MNQSETNGENQTRHRTASSGTISPTLSDAEDLSASPTLGDADDSSESRSIVPYSLKSVDALLSLSKTATLDDLHDMVDKCKKMVLETVECTEERKWLVRRLIELRLRAQEIRESTDSKLLETQVISGHHLVPQKYQIPSAGPTYCDHCSGAIWVMLQSWYICSDCGYSCHWKCLADIRRICAHVVASEAGGYTFTKDICPEKGLSAQRYKCAECHTKISFANPKGLSLSCIGSPFRQAESSWIEPRLCDYTGLYFCQRCHWNTLEVIPARVIRNWDMETRKVSRYAAQLLGLLNKRPVLLLEDLNKKLFSLVPDLSLLKKLREELQMMKKYLVFCPDADAKGLPWRIGLRTHMLESSANYSIKDLVDLQSGILMEEIRQAYDAMRSHITESCELCHARGHLCEICGNNEVIFPWNASAVFCQKCNTVYHRVCWSKRNHCCPKCSRIKKRLAKKDEESDINNIS